MEVRTIIWIILICIGVYTDLGNIHDLNSMAGSITGILLGYLLLLNPGATDPRDISTKNLPEALLVSLMYVVLSYIRGCDGYRPIRANICKLLILFYVAYRS